MTKFSIDSHFYIFLKPKMGLLWTLYIIFTWIDYLLFCKKALNICTKNKFTNPLYINFTLHLWRLSYVKG